MKFYLAPEQVPHFRPLPGHCLIKTAPPPYETPSGLVAIPKGIAHTQQELQEVRKGVIVKINRYGKRSARWHHLDHGSDLGEAHFYDGEADALHPGDIVHYWGHLNESDDAYVVAKIGQLVAVEQ